MSCRSPLMRDSKKKAPFQCICRPNKGGPPGGHPFSSRPLLAGPQTKRRVGGGGGGAKRDISRYFVVPSGRAALTSAPGRWRLQSIRFLFLGAHGCLLVSVGDTLRLNCLRTARKRRRAGPIALRRTALFGDFLRVSRSWVSFVSRASAFHSLQGLAPICFPRI